MEEKRSRFLRTVRFQMNWMMMTFHLFPWPHDHAQHRHRDL